MIDPRPSPSGTVTARVAAAVEEYRASADMAVLQHSLAEIIEVASADELVGAAEPWREIAEVAGPLYEKVVAAQPDNSRALVSLANAYWLSGRGPDLVNEIASRAIAADPANRGGWHMWALSEGDQRERTIRWRQIVNRFPDDDLARANLADNAASLASAEQDREAWEVAIAEYEVLLSRATHLAQRQALEQALNTLRGWEL